MLSPSCEVGGFFCFGTIEIKPSIIIRYLADLIIVFKCCYKFRLEN